MNRATLEETKRATLAAYGLYRRYAATVNRAPPTIQKKLRTNVKSLFVIVRHAEFTNEQLWELIDRGEKDLLLLQRVILLPEELLRPLNFRETSGMMTNNTNQNNTSSNTNSNRNHEE